MYRIKKAGDLRFCELLHGKEYSEFRVGVQWRVGFAVEVHRKSKS